MNIFILLFITSISLTIWWLFEMSQFYRPEGPIIKRGVKVWAEPLSREAQNFLESLSETKWYDKIFIRVEGRERLIGEKMFAWARRSHHACLYVGYINLSTPERLIELRVPWSVLTSFIFSFVGVCFGWLYISFRYLSFASLVVIPLLFISMLYYNHKVSRNRLISILNQAMQEPQ